FVIVVAISHPTFDANFRWTSAAGPRHGRALRLSGGLVWPPRDRGSARAWRRLEFEIEPNRRSRSARPEPQARPDAWCPWRTAAWRRGAVSAAARPPGFRSQARRLRNSTVP